MKAEVYEHTCPDDDECLACGARDCPAKEPLHWHHDGCPVCSFEDLNKSRVDARERWTEEAGMDPE